MTNALFGKREKLTRGTTMQDKSRFTLLNFALSSFAPT